MNLREALRLARAGELAMQAAYDDIARLTEDGDPGLVDLWQRMALVEAHHAEILDQIMSDLDPTTADLRVEVAPEHLERLVNRILSFRQRLVDTAVPMDEIFAFALDMEVGEQTGVLLQLLDQTQNRISDEIRHDIEKPSSSHIAPILNAIEEMSESDSLRARARKLRNGGE